MPVCTKTLVQVGNGEKNMFTVALSHVSVKHDALHLASMSLHSAARSVGVLERVAQMLQEVVVRDGECEVSQSVPAGDKAMCVRGKVVLCNNSATVICGTGVCCVDNIEMETGRPAVYASVMVDGVPVQVTCLICPGDAHKRHKEHFIAHDNRRCINIANLNTGRRCEAHVAWSPCQSHFLRRKITGESHAASFQNLGVKLSTNTHTKTPFFDVVLSEHNTFKCCSLFF